MTLQDRARQAHPNNEQHQAKWLRAVQFLGDRWVSNGAIGYKISEVKVEEPPLAHKVIRITKRAS